MLRRRRPFEGSDGFGGFRRKVPSRPKFGRMRRQPFASDARPLLDASHVQAVLTAAGVRAEHTRRVLKRVLRAPLLHASSSSAASSRFDVRAATREALAAMPNLPPATAEAVSSQCVVYTSRVVQAERSADRSTTKLLIELHDGNLIETVLIQTPSLPGRPSRVTLCVSSQVGCRMGCRFCATGLMGERGNLSAGEILEQVCHARRWATPRNIVFMGMGEPLNNYEAVRDALRTLTDEHLFYVAPSHITVSTVGVIPKMEELARDHPEVSLALSLHAPDQKLRRALLPSARQYPLDDLLASVDAITAGGRRTVQIEYTVLDGVNDSEEHARQLGLLLRGRRVYVNLIPYNHNPELRFSFRPPSEQQECWSVRQMQAVLQEMGVPVTVRTERGADIASACGQLSVKSRGTTFESGSACSVANAVDGTAAQMQGPNLLIPDYSLPIWKAQGSLANL
ncbi:hypothetical protein AB1Y20_005017 [Prymnesium parvum]|uniref:Radical SAM core domain-containing protein n=1 Tax=Prymnesium parvum TaxID=97485 RepID=A0AB34J325_PRYPA